MMLLKKCKCDGVRNEDVIKILLENEYRETD